MSNSKNIKRFLKILFKRNKLLAFIAFLIMLTTSILDLFLPQITKLILDSAIKFGRMNLLIQLVIIYGVISIVSASLNIVLSYIYSKMKKRVSVNLEITLLKHLSKLSGEYYANIKTGNILSIIEKDMFTIENFGADILFSLIVDAITAIIAFFLLIRMQFDLLLIVIILQLLLIFSQSKFNRSIVLKMGEVRQEAGNLSNLIQEYVSNIMNVVISKSRLRFFKNYIKREKDIVKKSMKLDVTISSNIAIANILSSLIVICIYGYGGFKIINGKMTLGELIAFQQYTSLLIGPCVRIIRSNTKIQQSAVSINRLFSVLDEPITIKQAIKGLE